MQGLPFFLSEKLLSQIVFCGVSGAILGPTFGQANKAMNFLSDIKPVSYLKSHSAELLTQVNETHRPIVITQNGEPRGVLQDTESYEAMRNAIGLLKLIAQGEEDIRKGEIVSQDSVFLDIENWLAQK